MILSDSKLSTILSELRESTRSLHEEIEMRVDVVRPGLTQEQYRRLLARFYGFYAPVERCLETLHRASPLLPDYLERRKTARLVQDLTLLGMAKNDVAELPLCSDLPRIDTGCHALGCLYVLEGATLGGQIISRHVAATLGLTSTNGCAFFSSYGQELGSMWRAFSSQISRFDHDPAARESIVAAAQETFRKFDAWLA